MSATTGHARACYCCRKEGADVGRQYLPGASGPGWIRYACTACAALPPDPELIPADVAQVLALRVVRMRRAS